MSEVRYQSQNDDRFYDPIIGELRTGLWVPETKSVMCRSFSSAHEINRADIVRKLKNSRRIPARVRFPAQQWIRNQGNRGSCNGYAVAGSCRRARKQRGCSDIPLSGESMYAQINRGVDQGSGLDRGMEALEKTGIAPESMVEHETYLWRNISAEARAAMPRFRGLALFGVDNELELAAALAEDYFCVVAMHFGNGSSSVDRNGFVNARNGVGNHAIGCHDCIVDSNGRFVFDCVNSHGVRSWDNGYGYMLWDQHFAQCSRNHRFYAIKSTVDDTEADNPFVVA